MRSAIASLPDWWRSVAAFMVSGDCTVSGCSWMAPGYTGPGLAEPGVDLFRGDLDVELHGQVLPRRRPGARRPAEAASSSARAAVHEAVVVPLVHHRFGRRPASRARGTLAAMRSAASRPRLWQALHPPTKGAGHELAAQAVADDRDAERVGLADQAPRRGAARAVVVGAPFAAQHGQSTESPARNPGRPRPPRRSAPASVTPWASSHWPRWPGPSSSSVLQHQHFGRSGKIGVGVGFGAAGMAP
jgi:hypothetical protein